MKTLTKIYVKTRDVSSLSEHDFNRLRVLTMRNKGTMESTFLSIRKDQKVYNGYLHISVAKTIVCYSDKEKTFITGWGLLFLTGDYWRIHIFVDPGYRRQGIGTKILKNARRISNRSHLMVSGWDATSLAFANSFD